jgi:hypothetical protein
MDLSGALVDAGVIISNSAATDTKANVIVVSEKESVSETVCESEYKFSEIDGMIDKAFKYKESNNSLICDILAMYLKGQKILYTEAKTHCEQRLNFLMLPAIFITAVCTILSLALLLTLLEHKVGLTVVIPGQCAELLAVACLV